MYLKPNSSHWGNFCPPLHNFNLRAPRIREYSDGIKFTCFVKHALDFSGLLISCKRLFGSFGKILTLLRNRRLTGRESHYFGVEYHNMQTWKVSFLMSRRATFCPHQLPLRLQLRVTNPVIQEPRIMMWNDGFIIRRTRLAPPSDSHGTETPRNIKSGLLCPLNGLAALRDSTYYKTRSLAWLWEQQKECLFWAQPYHTGLHWTTGFSLALDPEMEEKVNDILDDQAGTNLPWLINHLYFRIGSLVYLYLITITCHQPSMSTWTTTHERFMNRAWKFMNGVRTAQH